MARKPETSGSTAVPFAYLERLDPRARLVVAAAWAVAIVISGPTCLVALAFAFTVALGCLGMSGMSSRTIAARLATLNLLILLLFVMLPLTTPGVAIIAIGPIAFSREGLLLATAIALKGNAIVMMLLALLASMEPATLGHALSHLRVPKKLTVLLLLTIRYLDVLRQEYSRLSTAMKARAFRPGMNRHTYRTYGYLVGMLLVRGFERSNRIIAAMKCRGFRGEFFLFDHFAFSRRDGTFILAAMLLLGVVFLLQWPLLDWPWVD